VISLRHRDFRLLWIGQLISVVGDQMQSIGIAWHVYLLTNSALQLGLLGLFRAVPFMALSLAGGAMADTIERKRLLMMTQVSQMVLTAVLVVATATGHVSVWLLYAVTFCSGAATAFDAPARQAIVPSLIPREEIGGAMTVLVLQRRVAMIAGPGIGGLIIASFGLAPTYFGNALSFLAVVVAILMLGPVPHTPAPAVNNWDRLLGGLQFARREPLVLLPMLLDFVTRGCGSAQALLPIFAQDVFGTGAAGLGWLSSAMSAGSVAGGLVLGTAKRERRHPVAWMMVAYAAEGLAFAGFGLAHTFALGVFMLFLKGIANVFGEVLRVTILQVKTPDQLRGRVTALSGMFDLGGPQMGQLASGVMGDTIGPAGSVITSGVVTTAITIGFAFSPGLRRGLWKSGSALLQPASAS